MPLFFLTAWHGACGLPVWRTLAAKVLKGFQTSLAVQISRHIKNNDNVSTTAIEVCGEES